MSTFADNLGELAGEDIVLARLAKAGVEAHRAAPVGGPSTWLEALTKTFRLITGRGAASAEGDSCRSHWNAHRPAPGHRPGSSASVTSSDSHGTALFRQS